MEIPVLLKGTPHLPLKEGTLASEAIQLANTFYQTDLEVSDFQETQAFIGGDGQLTLELLGAVSNEVLVTFVNKSTVVAKAPEEVQDDDSVWKLTNPVFVTSAYHEWIADPVQLHSEEELAFLDAMGIGETYSVQGSDNSIAFQLATLLNSQQVLGRWVSGTLGDLCTGGFTLVFKGWSMEAPDGFLMDYSPMVAIIQINHGSKKGYLCLRT